MAKKINNITDLRNDLLDAYQSVRSGNGDLQQAKETSNLAGKIINSLKVQLAYAEMRKETPDITFIQ